MFLSEIKERVLVALKHGPLNHFEIAFELEDAPFRIKAELKDLERDRLVRQRGDDETWELTDRGHKRLDRGDRRSAPGMLRGGVDA